MSNLAIFGGQQALATQDPEMTKWPIYTTEEEEAVLQVLRNAKMSGTDITMQFEKEFADWLGTEYALGFNNGTAALHAAMYAVGLRRGDEMICPTVTYWASCTQAMSLGATVVFARVDTHTLCIDPTDIEAKITPRTKAIMVVHYMGHPCDMDAIMAIAQKHNLKVIEDVSHAQGGLYKGRRLGTIGDVGAMSLMTGKSFAIGEGGMLVTNQRTLYEYALAFGSYERFSPNRIETEALKPYGFVPLGGYKYRMHQMSSAVGRIQLKYYDERCAEIRKTMNYFWDLLEGTPGIRPRRVDEQSGSNMAGYYEPRAVYVKEELGGLSITRFCEALRAEGLDMCRPGCNRPLHTHEFFKTADVYGGGKPTRIAFSDQDIRGLDENLKDVENICTKVFSVPWLKKYIPEQIEAYANAIKKVCANYQDLLADDPGDPPALECGVLFFYKGKK